MPLQPFRRNCACTMACRCVHGSEVKHSRVGAVAEDGRCPTRRLSVIASADRGLEFVETHILEVATAHGRYDCWHSGLQFKADAAAKHARRIVAVMVAKEASRSAICLALHPVNGAGTTGSDLGRTTSAVR
jgi:hypothetical protein